MRKKKDHEFTSETGRAATKGRKPGSKKVNPGELVDD